MKTLLGYACVAALLVYGVTFTTNFVGSWVYVWSMWWVVGGIIVKVVVGFGLGKPARVLENLSPTHVEVVDILDSRSYAVVGGGAAGSAAAYELARRGHRVTVFELEDKAGGRTKTYRSKYLHFDTGAGFITDYYSLVWQYTARMKLTRALVELWVANKIVWEAKARSYTVRLGSAMSLIKLPFVTMAHKLYFMLHCALNVAVRWKLDMFDPTWMSAHDDSSVSQYYGRRFGQDTLNFLIRPGIESFFYFSVADASRALLQALSSRTMGTRFFTFQAGMDTLPLELLGTPGVKLCCNAEVQSVSLASGHVYGPGHVHGGSGAPSAIHAHDRDADAHDRDAHDRDADAHDGDDPSRRVELAVRMPSGDVVRKRFHGVVMATTASVASRLTAGAPDEWVHPYIRDFLGSQRYASTIQSAFVYRGERKLAKECSSAFAAGPGPHDVAAVCYASSKGQHGVPAGGEGVQVYLSDMGASKRLGLEERELTRTMWGLAKGVEPELPDDSVHVASIRHREAIPVPDVGRFKRAAAIATGQTGPVVFAGDYLSSATVEGAMRSGLWAVNRLLYGPVEGCGLR